jgi:hypothetical protein
MRALTGGRRALQSHDVILDLLLNAPGFMVDGS